MAWKSPVKQSGLALRALRALPRVALTEAI